MRALFALALAVTLAAPADARRTKRPHRGDPRTEGLGRHCKANSDCHHRAQVCLHENDANGKLLAHGFCGLPCAAFDEGLKKSGDAFATDGGVIETKAPPRCPKRYECRSAGAGVPIDLCVRQ